ncbi:MAG: hypothetical protein V8T10_08135 [Merdibacter sp.]
MEANEFSLEKMLMARAAQQYRPINGSIEPLPLCNMNCRMCYVRLSRQEMDQMGSLHPLEDWMRITEEMQKAGVVFMLDGRRTAAVSGLSRIISEAAGAGHDPDGQHQRHADR